MSDRKNKKTAAWLAILLGAVGIHRFYLEEHGRGMLYLLFCWTLVPLVLGVVDGLRLLNLPQAEFDRRYNDATLILQPHSERPPVHLPGPLQVNVAVGAPGGDIATQLEKLHTLREKGVLTEEEFQAQKARLLSTT